MRTAGVYSECVTPGVCTESEELYTPRLYHAGKHANGAARIAELEAENAQLRTTVGELRRRINTERMKAGKKAEPGSKNFIYHPPDAYTMERSKKAREEMGVTTEMWELMTHQPLTRRHVVTLWRCEYSWKMRQPDGARPAMALTQIGASMGLKSHGAVHHWVEMWEKRMKDQERRAMER